MKTTELLRLPAAFLLCWTFAGAHEPTASNAFTYVGTLGDSSIGLTLIVQGDSTVVGGHYFYGRYLKDIPLDGKNTSGTVALREPGGAAFTVHFVGNGSNRGKPLDFSNSVGLAGAWTKADQSLPVKLALKGISAYRRGQRQYAMVTHESDARFEARVQGFCKAAIGGDKQAMAKFIAFPLRVNANGKSRTIETAGALMAQWDRVFTPAYLGALKKEMPHDLGSGRNGQVMLGNGLAWFGAKGAEALNLP